MDEIETEIKKFLPSLDNEALKKLIQHLIDLGVGNYSDLELIEENDLKGILKTIQARLLIRSWKSNDKATCPVASSSNHEVPPAAGSDQSDSNILDRPKKVISNLDWAYNYEVPWERMPKELIKALEEDTRPRPSLRLKMIRIVCDDIRKFSEKPGRKAISIIARKIVNKYKLSLADYICNVIVGEGHSSLLRQIEVRIDNLNRVSPYNVLKRTLENDENKIKISDAYGCVNWQPSHLPVHETEKTQEAKKAHMLDLANYKNVDKTQIKKLLEDTYYTLRKDINLKKDINYLFKEWPLLFTKEGLLDHFKMLTDVDIQIKVNEAISSKGLRIYTFLKSLPCSKKLDNMNMGLPNGDDDDPDLATLIILLMCYFSEKIDELFQTIDVTVTAAEVEKMELPETPCLICYGEDVTNAKSYLLLVDRKVIMDDIRDFSNGFTLLFACYFNFNIHYPKSAATTLEFIQRCFLEINPNRGSKAEKKKRKNP